jgi:hypothetical protein
MSNNDQDGKLPQLPKSPEREDARRRLLKTLAAGGVAGAALPAQWTRPVIEAVVLPAHAQATGGAVTGGGGGGGQTGGPGPAGSVGESILNFFVSPAQAQNGLSAYCIEVFATVANGVATSVKVTRVQHPCPKGGLGDVPVTGATLSGSGKTWAGTVSGHYLKLENFNPTAAVLANADYGGTNGIINNGATCGASDCALAEGP